MPSTPTSHYSNVDDTVAGTKTSTAFTPGASALLLAHGFHRHSGNLTETLTIADTLGGLGWAKVGGADNVSADNGWRHALWLAVAPASPSEGTVSVTGMSTPDRRGLQVVEIASGFDATTPLVQSKPGGGTGTTLTVTLDATPATDSLAIGFYAGLPGDQAGPTEGGDFVELIESTVGTGNARYAVQNQYGEAPAAAACPWTALKSTRQDLGIVVEIAAAAGTPVERLAQVAYESLAGAAAERLGLWESAIRVISARLSPHESLSPSGKNGESRIESLAGVRRNGISPLESKGSAVSARPSPWESKALLRREAVSVLEALAAISADRISRLETLSTVRRLAQARFEALSRISSSRISIWEALSSAEPVFRDATSFFEALAAVRSERSGLWESLQPASASRTARVENLAAIRSDGQSPMEVLARIASDGVSIWEALGAAGVVSRDATSVWESLGVAASERISALESLLPASADRQSAYESLVPASIERSSRLESLAGARRDVEALFEALGSSRRQASSPWESLGRAQRLAVCAYEVLSLARRSGLSVWEALAAAAASGTVPWESLGDLVDLFTILAYQSEAQNFDFEGSGVYDFEGRKDLDFS